MRTLERARAELSAADRQIAAQRAGIAFRSVDELNRQLGEWIDKVAHARVVPGDAHKRRVLKWSAGTRASSRDSDEVSFNAYGETKELRGLLRAISQRRCPAYAEISEEL
jgi:hypothetical protein